MSLSYANVLAEVLQYLQDSGAAIFATAETQYGIENELKHMSKYSPLIIDVIYKIESRTGTDTAGTASSLTDTTKSQFVAADATGEKVVHNITDHTWAVVLANSSTSVNTLSRDIMDISEKYEIYNKRCRNNKQIYIGDMPTYLWIESVEYPIGTRRNYTRISEDVIELDVKNGVIRDSDSTLSSLNKTEVLVKFAVPHILSQLTDWGGELTANQSEGDVRVAIDGLSGTETIEVGEQFYLENHRSVYIVNREVELISGAEDIDFYPPLEADASDNDDITFVKSSLSPQLEEILVRMIAGRACVSKSTSYYGQVKSALTELADASTAIADVADLIALATTASTGDIALARIEIEKAANASTGAIKLASTEFDKIVAVTVGPTVLATSALASGLSLVNTIPVGGGAAEFMGQAASQIGLAQGHALAGQTYLQEASADHANAAQNLSAASADFKASGEKVNEAIANLRLVASRLQVSQGGVRFEEWGRREIAQAEAELRGLAGYRTTSRYPRD